MDTLIQNEYDEARSSPPNSSSIWKILNGKNGDKYLTFNDASFSNRENSSRKDSEVSNRPIKLYKLRWYILAVICFANISNAINWINFSPIADTTGKFYSIDFDKVNYLSLVYLISSTPAGFFSFWLIDTFGVRLSLNLGSWTNLIGSIVRLFSALNNASGEAFVPQEYKYAVLMTGQTLCSLAQPFILFVVTKFATNWFPDNQRSLANTVALGSNTLGILIGAVVSPLIVNNSNTFVSEMCILLLICTVIALVPAIMACFITRSTPPTPPNNKTKTENCNSGSIQDTDQLGNRNQSFSNDFRIYLQQVKKLLKSRDFLILFFCFGLALGVFNCFSTLIEQIVCTHGYSDDDSGYFSGAMIVSGLIGSIVSGIILDKTKRFEELSKFCFGMGALGNIALVICFQWNNDNGLIYYLTLFSFCFLGFFALPLLPICMDMSVECVYPIPEATSTGLLFIAGQVVGIVMIVLYPILAKKVEKDSYVYNYIQTCVPKNSTTSLATDLSVLEFMNPLYGQTVIFALMSVFFTIFFKCAYLRLLSERKIEAEKIMHSARRSSNND